MMTPGQYSLFRALFGAYLAVHFGYLLPFSAELFSSAGMLPDAGLSPLMAFAPSLLHLNDSPWFVQMLMGSGVLAAGLLAVGKWDKPAAAWLLLLLISVFARNPLIANPAMPYVGFMLLVHCATPRAPYGSLAALGADDPGGGWSLPKSLFIAATVVLAVSYSYSGWTKLFSPGWVSGETISYVLENPLARDWWLRDLALLLPASVWKGVTWFILYVELLFAPLMLIKRARPWLWLGMLGVQFGFLFLLRFPDLTIAMLLFHLLTFDPRWLASKKLGPSVLHYDGNCGVCHAATRFALAEVTERQLSFRPIQRDGMEVEADTWQLTTLTRTYERTDAVIRLLFAAGGVWAMLGWSLKAIPRPLRDAGYGVLAKVRRRLMPAPDDLCPMLAPELRERFQ